VRNKTKPETEALTNNEELPSNWCWATIGDTGKYINGFAFKPAHRASTGLPIIRIQNLTDESKPLNRTNIDVPEDYYVSPGELLVSWSATLDAFIWNREKALLNQHIFRVVPDTYLVEPRLLYHWLKIAIQQLIDTEHLHGSTMKHINRGPFMAHNLPLPPLAEQTRIADKLEELLTDLDAGVDELKAAQRKLPQYRQSLLKSAFEGELTAKWRTKNKPKETGAQLLERILKVRRTRWEEKQLAKFKEQGKTTPKGWQDKYPEPVQPDTANLLGLPEGWAWASLDCLIEDGPQNGLYLPSEKYGRGHAILRIDDFQIGWVRTRAELNLVDADVDTAATYSLRSGDVVINRVNSMTHLGKSLVVSEALDSVLFESNMMKMRLSPLTSTDYVGLYLGAEVGRKRLISNAKWAVNQASINQQDVKRTPIPFPPFEEQVIINEIVATQLTSIEAEEKAITYGLMQSVAQRKNILKDAFSGRLVPQNPADEPANILLERVRTERAELEKQSKKRKSEKVPVMSIFDANTIRDWIKAHPKTCFTFDELRSVFPSEYELLKDSLFQLLAEDNSVVEQIFDQTSGIVQFKKVTP